MKRVAVAGWRIIAGRRIYFRSKAEANYARYLELLREKGNIQQWDYEIETFWFPAVMRGVRSYLPDFRVIDARGTRYVEMKGYMDQKSRTKLKRLAKYHPSVVLALVDSKAYKRLAAVVGPFIRDWE